MKINLCTTNECCGCAVCVSVCPTKAISIHEGKEHFLFPKINENKCISCHHCENICPAKNIPIPKNKETRVFSAYAKNPDILTKGSSGSIFYQLGKVILDEKGIVFGAAFDENHTLRHIAIDDINDLDKLCKSKYIQSNTTGVFEQTKKFLHEDRYVLFVGTPCQIAALKNFLGKDYDKLLLVDFICHGVPNQWLFNKYISFIEQEKKATLIQYTFRRKIKSPTSPHICSYILEKKGKKLYRIKNFDQDLYYTIYKKYIAFRESCYNCKYASTNRISDLTLGDFWKIEQYDPSASTLKGVSMLSIHTLKGMLFFQKIKCDNIVNEYNEKIAIDSNFSYSNKTKRLPQRNQIYEDFEKFSYSKLKKIYGYKKKTLKRIIKTLLIKCKIIKINH